MSVKAKSKAICLDIALWGYVGLWCIALGALSATCTVIVLEVAEAPTGTTLEQMREAWQQATVILRFGASIALQTDLMGE
jgi:hypothetical protein